MRNFIVLLVSSAKYYLIKCFFLFLSTLLLTKSCHSFLRIYTCVLEYTKAHTQTHTADTQSHIFIPILVSFKDYFKLSICTFVINHRHYEITKLDISFEKSSETYLKTELIISVFVKHLLWYFWHRLFPATVVIFSFL